ncbi:MAG TPA: hypothetical protein VMP01_22740 [Pirellulaceae bacterium]|nr:hypothetical protein [Pirellulaceae bacterium]
MSEELTIKPEALEPLFAGPFGNGLSRSQATGAPSPRPYPGAGRRLR